MEKPDTTTAAATETTKQETATPSAARTTEALMLYRQQELLRIQQAKAETEILPKRKLEELVRQVDPTHALDAEVEDLLVDMANDFVERVVTFSCQLAKHRGSDVLETKDVQLHLERNWNIRIPGYLREDARAPKPPKVVDAHKQRVQAVQKDANGAAKRRRTDGDANRA
eukprot:m.286166 g.286166  ORF g.286166 m.286166 type:complete len:170 (-) comp19924_c1_seq6:1293-1802(-)